MKPGVYDFLPFNFNLCIFVKVIFIVDHQFFRATVLKLQTQSSIWNIYIKMTKYTLMLMIKIIIFVTLTKAERKQSKTIVIRFLKVQKEWVVFKEEFWLGSITLEYLTVLTLTSVSSLEFVMYERWRIKELRLVSFIWSVIQDLNRR